LINPNKKYLFIRRTIDIHIELVLLSNFV